MALRKKKDNEFVCLFVLIKMYLNDNPTNVNCDETEEEEMKERKSKRNPIAKVTHMQREEE